MSKRLTEEAMAYFDECVSLSTFDSSDFSAPEDLLFSSVGGTLSTSLAKGSPRTSCSYEQDSVPEQVCAFSSFKSIFNADFMVVALKSMQISVYRSVVL